MLSLAFLLRLITFRRFLCIALVASFLMTVATIALLHRQSTPDSIGLINLVPRQRPSQLQVQNEPVRPMSNVTTLSSGTLYVLLYPQKSPVTHVFDIPFEGSFQIQILFERLGGRSVEQPPRMQVLVNFMHRLELNEVAVIAAATKGWWTVGSTALPAGKVSVSVQRVDDNVAATLQLNGIRVLYMGASSVVAGDDCVSLDTAPDIFFSSDIYKCPEEEEVAFLDDKDELRSRTCAQSDLVLLVPAHNFTLQQVSFESSHEQEQLIAQCKARDAAKPAAFITRVVKKELPFSHAPGSQKISVVHIFMDSIARAVGITKLPKTMNLLRNIRVSSDFKQWQLLDMRGYSVLGGGTNRNMPPMVSGTDGRNTPAWDEPGWLFNDFRNNNYVTGFVADECVLDHNSMVRMMSQEWSGSGSKFKDELKRELRQKADNLAHHTLYNVICGVQEYGDLDDNWVSFVFLGQTRCRAFV